jgi:hypothetical protein
MGMGRAIWPTRARTALPRPRRRRASTTAAFPIRLPTGAASPADGNLIDAQNLIFRDALISDSLNNNSGVVAVNNSAGNLNNQGNVLSIAFSLAPEGVALAESDLGQFNSWNRVFESDTETQDDQGDTVPLGIGINKQANITGSINGNTGVLGVNNASGNMANQANVFSVALVQTLQ